MTDIYSTIPARIKAVPAEIYWRVLGVFAALAGMYFLSNYNYLLFHTLTELFTIIIAVTIFIIVWNSRDFLSNNYLLFIGISFVFLAVIDLAHTLAYKGLNIFPAALETNYATQLWIAARYLQSFSLLAALLFIKKKLNPDTLFWIFGAITLSIMLSILYWQIFPVSYIEGVGLTPFKKVSEYVISAIFLFALAAFLRKRDLFEKNVTFLLSTAIITAIFSELSFTLYVGVYGFFNMAGHILKIVSFYLFYRAFIVTSFKNPYSLILRSLKKKELALKSALDESKNQQEELSSLFQSSRAILAHHEFEGAAELIFNRCKKFIRADLGCVVLYGENGGNNNILFGAFNGIKDFVDFPDSIELKELRQRALSSGKTAYSNNFDKKIKNNFLDNVMISPLIIKEESVGFLGFANKEGGFNDNDKRTAASFAKLTSIALYNSRTLKLLENSEEKFRSLATSAGDAIISADSRGFILSWNKGAETIFGYEEKEVIGKPIGILVPGNYIEAHKKGLERMSAGGKPKIIGKVVDMEGVRKNGELFPLELSISTWRVGDEIFYGAVIRDVSSRKQNEEALQKSEEKYRNIVDNSLVGVYKSDLNGNFTYANKTMAKIFEFSSLRDFLNENAALRYKEPEKLTELLEILKKTGKVNLAEFEGVTKNGKIKNIILTMSLEGENEISGIVIDVTKRRKTEEKLKIYAEKLAREKAESEAFLMNINDAVIATDPRGKIIFANKAVERLCGVKIEEIINRDLDEALPFIDEKDNSVPKEKRPIYIVLNPKNKIFPWTEGRFYYFNRPKNKKIPLRISATPIIVKGKITGAIVFWMDISHEKALDQAKNEFISFASHQLRTPLTSINLAVDMLLNYLNEKVSGEQKKYLKIAQKSAREMTDIIETMLNISRIDMGTLQTHSEITNLVKFTDKILEDFSMQIRDKKIILEKNYCDGVEAVKTDRRLLKLVLENFISNAVKYSPGKSEILIKIKKYENKEIVFSVSDTGPGIPVKQQPRVFEKLFRVHAQDGIKGTGLGLYIAKAAIEEVGGKIWCQSPSRRAFSKNKKYLKGQKGTTFFAALPLNPVKTEK